MADASSKFSATNKSPATEQKNELQGFAKKCTVAMTIPTPFRYNLHCKRITATTTGLKIQLAGVVCWLLKKKKKTLRHRVIINVENNGAAID